MALDAYSLCPGGTGKKIKFCCPDFVSELEKIDRMIEGEQFIACIQHIDQHEQKGQYRACLMSIKSELLRVTSQIDGAGAYAADFIERFPQSSTAWSEAALLSAVSEGGQAGMSKLQRAIALCDGNIQSRVYEAAAVVANVLIQEGRWGAGRALLQFLSTLDPEDRDVMERLIYLNRSAEIPVLLKSDAAILPCPPDAPWRARFEAAVAPLKKAQWQEAADRLTTLAAEVVDAPAVWSNLALVRGWLADEAGAREALEKFAELAVPLEDAVESEAVAMLISDSPLGDEVEIVRWTWPVSDPERLQNGCSPIATCRPCRLMPRSGRSTSHLRRGWLECSWIVPRWAATRAFRWITCRASWGKCSCSAEKPIGRAAGNSRPDKVASRSGQDDPSPDRGRQPRCGAE